MSTEVGLQQCYLVLAGSHDPRIGNLEFSYEDEYQILKFTTERIFKSFAVFPRVLSTSLANGDHCGVDLVINCCFYFAFVLAHTSILFVMHIMLSNDPVRLSSATDFSK